MNMEKGVIDKNSDSLIVEPHKCPLSNQTDRYTAMLKTLDTVTT